MNPRLDGSNGTGFNVYIPMGMTAENVAERCKVTREAQDECPRSHASNQASNPLSSPNTHLVS